MDDARKRQDANHDTDDAAEHGDVPEVTLVSWTDFHEATTGLEVA